MIMAKIVRNWFAGEGRRSAAIAVAVAAAAFALVAPSIRHDFCLMDDAYFVVENPLVQGGLTWPGIQAAWTSIHASYWAPLLWMSFMVDQELSGGAPWSFHLSNAVYFALSVGLVFALARRWTGRTGVAAATALLWAFHPARVESVAWITERKDVLSGLFFLLGLWFYTVGRQPTVGNQASSIPGRGRPGSNNRSATFNLQPATLVFLSWICMLLGGMAKQVVIVMPAALLLLDVWPLGRTGWSRFWRDLGRLVAEKWAFWLLAAAYVALAIWTQARENAILDMSLRYRLALVPIHYLFYLHRVVWPVALAPLQEDLPLIGWQSGVGLAVLVAATAAAWRFRIRAPWALWGWLWFVGLLFPLSGVVWAGSERMPVRFLYLPQIGLTLAGVMALAALGRKCGASTRLLGGLTALLLLVCGDVTLRTLMHWRNPDAFGLWLYECHPRQGAACAIGGDVYVATGQWAEAMKAYEQGVELVDKSCFMRLCMLWNHLGHEERTLAEWDGFEKALGRPLGDFAAWERAPERELFWRVRGQALRAQGDYAGAIAALQEAVRWESDPGALVVADFLRACHEGGRPGGGAEAAERMAAATGIRVRAWRDLRPCYEQMWKMGARGHAYAYFADYANRFPEDGVALARMAWLLATSEPDGLAHARMEEWPQAAVRWAEAAAQQEGDLAASRDAQGALAAARAYAGDFSGAVQAAEKACDLATEKGDAAIVETIEKQIMNYRLGLAWRE